MRYIVLAALVIGLMVYLLCSEQKASGKAARIGELMFFAAMLALFIALAPASATLFR